LSRVKQAGEAVRLSSTLTPTPGCQGPRQCRYIGALRPTQRALSRDSPGTTGAGASLELRARRGAWRRLAGGAKPFGAGSSLSPTADLSDVNAMLPRRHPLRTLPDRG